MQSSLSDEDILKVIDDTILNFSRNRYISIKERSSLRKNLFNTLRGLDILQELIDDPTISEIMVNGCNDIFIEQNGSLKKTELSFGSRRDNRIR